MSTPPRGRRFGLMLSAVIGSVLLTAPLWADAPPDPSPDPPKPARVVPLPVAVAAAPKPPPLHVEYAQYGVALTAEMLFNTGATCPETIGDTKRAPCILGSGGGLTIRGGYRSPGPWYIGGAYEFIKMDSSNLYRLGIFQQARAEMRYMPDTGYRANPYVAWGLGAVGYGNEWGLETGGGVVMLGTGVEVEVSRLAVLGVGLSYRPVLLAGWTDTAGFVRKTGVVQFFALDLVLEVRSELGRR